MKYDLVGTEGLPEGSFVNLDAAGPVVDEEGVTHRRLVRGQTLSNCTVAEPSRLDAAVAAGHMTVEEVEE